MHRQFTQHADKRGDLLVRGQGFPPNTNVPISFNGVVVVTAAVGADGTFEDSYQVPNGTPFGEATFSAVCGTFALSASIT